MRRKAKATHLLLTGVVWPRTRERLVDNTRQTHRPAQRAPRRSKNEREKS